MSSNRIIIFFFLLTGTASVLFIRWAENTRAWGKNHGTNSTSISEEAEDPPYFSHPFFQTALMAVANFMCLPVFWIAKLVARVHQLEWDTGNQKFYPFIFIPAAVGAFAGWYLPAFGSYLTYKSSYLSLYGISIGFAALMSIAFLGRTYKLKTMAVGMVLAVIGLVVFGIANIVYGCEFKDIRGSNNGIIAGFLLISLARIVIASQVVYEEKFFVKYEVPPLQAVGWEGLFGSIVSIGLLFVLYVFESKTFSPGQKGNLRVEDSMDALYQIYNMPLLVFPLLGNMICNTVFNVLGITIAKKQEWGATARMFFDSLCLIPMWIVSCSVGWMEFNGLQILGTLMLSVGAMLYCDVIIVPLLRALNIMGPAPEPEDNNRQPNERTPLLNPVEPDIQVNENNEEEDNPVVEIE